MFFFIVFNQVKASYHRGYNGSVERKTIFISPEREQASFTVKAERKVLWYHN